MHASFVHSEYLEVVTPVHQETAARQTLQGVHFPQNKRHKPIPRMFRRLPQLVDRQAENATRGDEQSQVDYGGATRAHYQNCAAEGVGGKEGGAVFEGEG